MEKVTVTKKELEVFNKIANFYSHNKAEIMSAWCCTINHEFKNIDFDKIIALIYGNYKVEITPIEQLELQYSDILRNRNIYYEKCDSDNTSYYNGYLEAMRDIARTLKLEVHFNNK